jgi:hypothetical protein
VRVITHKLFKPVGADISFAAVEAEITGLSDRFELKGCYYDPYQMESAAQRMRATGINMVAFAQTPANLEAAASNLLTLVSERNIVTYQSDELRTAIGNCRSVETVRGFRISKIVGSRKIDLAAALSFAALACVKEGQHAEPGLIGFTREAAIRAHQPDTPIAQQPRPPAEELFEEWDEDEDSELIDIYDRGQSEVMGSSRCAHCAKPIMGTSSFNGLHYFHPECAAKRLMSGQPV